MAVVTVTAAVQLSAPAVDETLPEVIRKAALAQETVGELRVRLSIPSPVQVAVVIYHPLVFSVEPAADDGYLLSIELGFLQLLDENELRAALAHELGHVWIFTHHPYLQTERLANDIAKPAADRRSFESLYRKLWDYEGTPGVAIEALLGPEDRSDDNNVVVIE